MVVTPERRRIERVRPWFPDRRPFCIPERRVWTPQGAIAFRQKAFGTAASGTTFTMTEPAATASGDLLLALVMVNDRSHTVTRPSGWTNLYTAIGPSAGVTNSFSCSVDYIVRGGSAPALGWTTSGGIINYWEGHILGFTGVDGTTPIDASSTTGSTGTGTVPPNPTAATATLTTDMSVALGIHWAGSPSGGWVAPTGYTFRSDNTVGNDGMMASKLLSASGSEDPAGFTSGAISTSDVWNGATVLLKAAGAAAAASLLFQSRTARNAQLRR